MDTDHGLDLPRRLQIEFSKRVQEITEASGTVIRSGQMRDVFEEIYLPEDAGPAPHHERGVDRTRPHERDGAAAGGRPAPDRDGRGQRADRRARRRPQGRPRYRAGGEGLLRARADRGLGRLGGGVRGVRRTRRHRPGGASDATRPSSTPRSAQWSPRRTGPARGDPPGGRGGRPRARGHDPRAGRVREPRRPGGRSPRTTSPAALFGPDAVAHDSVVEDGAGGLAGHALWYRTFSTFLGRTGIWLEDIYVRPAHRRQGHASELLTHLRDQTEGRLEWEVLEWNAPAMDFYQRLGARPMAGWTRYRWFDG